VDGVCIGDDSTTDSSRSSRASSPASSLENQKVQSLEYLMQSPCFDDSFSGHSSTQFASNELLCLDEADSVSILMSLAATTSMTPIPPCDFSQKLGCRVPLCPQSPLVTEEMMNIASHETSSRCLTSTTRSALKSPGVKPKGKSSVRFEDASFKGDDLATAPAPKRTALTSCPALTPNTLLTKGFVVRGTFLDVLPMLPTPVRRDASCRSRSVPKDMGSDTLCEGSCNSGISDLNTWEPGRLSPKHAEATPSMCLFPPTPWY